ncbi:MAG: hypothetical protein GY768_01280 [Planctomycetaceae bacterium]|nr:hypothetical protein [Planctomycetaceae bacterium]
MSHPLQLVLERDPRYPVEAYEFVRDALAYAQDVMDMGKPDDVEVAEKPTVSPEVSDQKSGDEEPQVERHLTGQELCEACRRYAIEQYGMMARVVLGNWNIDSTNDVGEIVYNLIGVDLMRKSSSDQREDFNDVYDFKKAFDEDFDFAAGQANEEES